MISRSEITVLFFFTMAIVSCTETNLEPVLESKNVDAKKSTDADTETDSVSSDVPDNASSTVCEGVTCDAHASCENRDGVPQCICNDGWTGDGNSCSDMNECAFDQHECDLINGLCINETEGQGYRCDCKDGWTLQSDGKTCAPSVFKYKQIATGEFFTCGLKMDDTIVCWGDNEWGQSVPYNAVYKQITAGPYHACGLKKDGTVICWGQYKPIDNWYDAPLSPFIGDRDFKYITAGWYFTCGLSNDNQVYLS